MENLMAALNRLANLPAVEITNEEKFINALTSKLNSSLPTPDINYAFVIKANMATDFGLDRNSFGLKWSGHQGWEVVCV